MKRAALYARVSTADQNPEMQLTELRRYAAQRHFEIVREYCDVVTGKVQRNRKDPDYRALLADAHRKRFDVVLVWKFDRFARSLTALIDALQTFSALQIDFISCTQQIDTTTPMGRLFFHLVGSFAEFERELIVERSKAGLANAKANGVQLGRPRHPDVERRVRELKQRGKSLRQIGRVVSRSPANVRMILMRQP